MMCLNLLSSQCKVLILILSDSTVDDYMYVGTLV